MANEENNLVAALQAAPSAAETIETDLEKIASERRSLESALAAIEAARAQRDGVRVDPATIRAFAQALGPRLRAMGVAERRELLPLLGFEATVAEPGDVKASTAVPGQSGHGARHRLTFLLQRWVRQSNGLLQMLNVPAPTHVALFTLSSQSAEARPATRGGARAWRPPAEVVACFVFV